MAIHKCKHPACACHVQTTEFCSESCRQASRDVSKNPICDCNHPDCER